MKKFVLRVFAALMAALMLVSLLPVAADETESFKKFSEDFLTDGTVGAPEELYVKVEEYDRVHSQMAAMYYTQCDEVMAIIDAYESLGYDDFLAKYGCELEDDWIQYDIKIDDGDWHYNTNWDEGNYDDSNLPDLMCFYNSGRFFDNAKLKKERGFIDLWYMEDDGSNWADFAKFIKQEKNDEGNAVRYMDLENHTLSFRARYCLEMKKPVEDADDEFLLVFSDWSEETTIGKEGTQIPLTMPETLEAPILSNLEFADGRIADDDFITTNWDLYWTIPDSIYAAQKYMLIEEDDFEPIVIDTECRVNGGEWTSVLVANQSWIYGGNRGLTAEGCDTDDLLEVRARFLFNGDGWDAEGPWSDIVANRAGDPTPDSKPESTPESEAESLPEEDPEPVRSKCKVCGICPFQPLGICLFIWLALILIVLILICIIAKKIKKAKKNKEKK